MAGGEVVVSAAGRRGKRGKRSRPEGVRLTLIVIVRQSSPAAPGRAGVVAHPLRVCRPAPNGQPPEPRVARLTTKRIDREETEEPLDSPAVRAPHRRARTPRAE